MSAHSKPGVPLIDWTPERDAEFAKLWNAGSSYAKICEAMGLDPKTHYHSVRNRRQTLGLNPRPRHNFKQPGIFWTPDKDAILRQMLADNAPHRDICRAVGLPEDQPDRITKRRNRLGIPGKNRGQMRNSLAKVLKERGADMPTLTIRQRESVIQTAAFTLGVDPADLRTTRRKGGAVTAARVGVIMALEDYGASLETLALTLGVPPESARNMRNRIYALKLGSKDSERVRVRVCEFLDMAAKQAAAPVLTRPTVSGSIPLPQRSSAIAKPDLEAWHARREAMAARLANDGGNLTTYRYAEAKG